MITIVGGGFGLYGYLPAVIKSFKNKVLLAERYQETIHSRPELHEYLPFIEWYPSISAALNEASVAIIAVPPRYQPHLVDIALNIETLRTLIIEKPVCIEPERSDALLNMIMQTSRRLRVAYTFLYSTWYFDLKKIVNSCSAMPLRVSWSFRADHFKRNRQTWKRYHSLGGGALRFYGIHLLATLASLGYDEVTDANYRALFPDEPEAWSATFWAKNKPTCEIIINTNSDSNSFCIEFLNPSDNRVFLYREISPFLTQKQMVNIDPRVPVLELLLSTLPYNDDEYISIYRATNQLWLETEKKCSIGNFCKVRV